MAQHGDNCYFTKKSCQFLYPSNRKNLSSSGAFENNTNFFSKSTQFTCNMTAVTNTPTTSNLNMCNTVSNTSQNSSRAKKLPDTSFIAKLLAGKAGGISSTIQGKARIIRNECILYFFLFHSSPKT